MKRYPAYKDSGIEWIGKIPTEWIVRKLKYSSKINPTKGMSVFSKDSEELVVFLPMEKVNTDGSFINDTRKPINELWNGFTYFEEDDVIIAKITPCFENGKGAYLHNLGSKIGFGSTEFHVLRERKNRSIGKYLFYITKSAPFRRMGATFMYGAAGQKRVPSDFIEEFSIGFPPVKEQQAIADCLDRKTVLIDDLIAKKQRQIELLKEQRQAVINHAVTKGLIPDVKMKDSGIDWLGKIPRHWEVRNLKYLCKVNLSNVDKKSYEGEIAVRLCNYTDVYYNEFITSKMSFMEATATQEQMDRFSLRQGDVLITKDSEEWNDIAVSAYVSDSLKNVVCGYHLAHIRPLHILGNYLFRSFQAKTINEQFQVAANGITRYGIGKYDIENALFLLPPSGEQQAIADFLDKITSQIDGSINKSEQQIQLLQEYRTSLISEAVTGKIDVREAG